MISRYLKEFEKMNTTTDSIYDGWLAMSSSKTFKYLDELIHSGAKEIILDSDIFLDSNEELEYINGIELDVNNIIIDGNGHTEILQLKILL